MKGSARELMNLLKKEEKEIKRIYGKVSDREIDFVCENRGSKLYVQVAYLLASDDTVRREFDVFSHIRDNFPKYVVTLDEFDMSRDGIRHCNIRDFLLMEEWG